MKRIIISIMAMAVCLAGQTASAQTLKDLLKKATNNETVKNVVESVTGTTLPVDVKGTWTYSGTAVKFESEDLLKSTAASLAAGQVEDKLDEYVQKVGIKAGTFSFTFNEDKTFVVTVKGKNFNGTYTVSEDYTRITEFKKLTGQKKPEHTTIVKEYPIPYTGKNGEIPYYSIVNDDNLALYAKYCELVKDYPNFHLLGRLAEYKYYNIDAIVDKALALANTLLG